MPARPLLALALAPALVVLALARPAAAFEPTGNAVADGFLRIVESGGFADVAIAGSGHNEKGTVLTGLTASAPGRNERLAIGTVVIVGGMVDGANALRAEVIQYADVAMTNIGDGSVSRATALTITPARLPLREAGASWLATVLGEFQQLVLEGLAARPATGSAVAVERIEVVREDDADPAAGRIAFQRARVDAAFFQGGASTVLTDLGYDTLTLSGTLAGRWNAADGATELAQLAIAAGDVGAVVMSGSASGLSGPRLAALGQSLGSVSVMLPLLQEVRLTALTLAFRDGGLTERLLAHATATSGASTDAVRERIVDGVARVVALVGSEGLTTQATDAARRFLLEPGTLTIAAEPAEAVSLAQIVGGALLKPQLLPQLLNLSITVEP
ncbi:hypothetical protein [Acuticoccus sp. I52.16.1]|uniref:hypothetical protein n=1 Tax=Acuticoccus sp. I52.16.1 TaxID=2928472 RepID=UPI001FD33B6A|nr:hypothetical protein [Acuticoccus sp. I52.16.1]UOM34599.1 hypothetical protein MRB58_22765 [Acuticoccus sp. I52.16.1]